MTLEAIKAVIAELPGADRASLTAGLLQRDGEAWDKQIEANFSEGGRGMALLESWDTEIKAGRASPGVSEGPGVT